MVHRSRLPYSLLGRCPGLPLPSAVVIPFAARERPGMAEEDEEIFIFVSLEGVGEALPLNEIAVDGLLTDNPKIAFGGRSFPGIFDEDVGSTMFFDRAKLKRTADAQTRETNALSLAPSDEAPPLVAITAKRLRVTSS